MTNPVAWCERKRDEAKDGETAYHYHQLAEMWKLSDKRQEQHALLTY